MNLNSNKTLLILNGEIDLSKVDLSLYSKVFPVDGGTDVLIDTKIIPEIIIGDLDSISAETLSFYKNKGVKIEKYPDEKDYSDTELVLNHILKHHKNIKNIDVIGAFSLFRMDHFLINLHTFYRYANRLSFNIICDDFKSIITSESVDLEDLCVNTPLSIISVSDRCIFNKSEGLKYPLDGLIIEKNSSHGLSNIIKTSRIKISIREGIFNIILPAGKIKT